VSEYSDTSSGVQSKGDIEFALNYASEGAFGSVPETIHEKSFHLLRLLVANHPFVDGNKRTALNTASIRERSERFTAGAGETRGGGLFSVDFCTEWFRTK